VVVFLSKEKKKKEEGKDHFYSNPYASEKSEKI